MDEKLPAHRVIWDPGAGFALVHAAMDGCDGTLNAAGAEILRHLIVHPQDYDQLESYHPSFFDQCQNLGWLANGSFSGTFAEVPQGDPHLKRLQIELTRHCNLSCSYCYSESGPRKRTRLTLAKVQELLDDAAEMGCIWVDFTGGDPFMWPEWKSALLHARRRGLVVTLHSNGTMLTEENLKYLQSVGLRHLQVSFDSHIPEVHDAARGHVGAFERSVVGLERARAIGIPVRVTLMAHRGNKESFPDTVSWFARLGIPVALDRVIAAGGELQAKVGLSTKEYYELIAPLVGRDVRRTRICDSPIESENPKGEIEPHCGVAQSFVYVTADGEFALCPTMTSRERPEFRGPTVDEWSLKTAWSGSPYFNRYRYSNCANARSGKCPAAVRCGGGCRSNAYIESGKLDAPDYLSCNLHKNPDGTFVDFRARYESGIFSEA